MGDSDWGKTITFTTFLKAFFYGFYQIGYGSVIRNRDPQSLGFSHHSSIDGINLCYFSMIKILTH